MELVVFIFLSIGLVGYSFHRRGDVSTFTMFMTILVVMLTIIRSITYVMTGS